MRAQSAETPPIGKSATQRRLLGEGHLASVAALLFVAALVTVAGLHSGPFWDANYGWHFLTGDAILRTGQAPHRQILAWAAHGAAWSDAQWLGDVLIAFAARVGGERAYLILSALVIGVVAALLTRGRAEARTFLSALVAAYGISLFVVLWPALLSYALFGFALYALDRLRDGRLAPLFVSAALLPLWVGIHPSWPLWFGLLLWEALAGGRNTDRRALLLAVLLGALLVVAVPGALEGYAQLLYRTLSGAGGFNTWGSPDFHIFVPAAAVLAVLPLALAPALYQRRDYARLGWLALGAFASLLAIRLIPYAFLGLAAVLAGAPLLSWRLRPWVTRALFALFALLFLATAVFGRFAQSPLASPIAYLRAHGVTRDVLDYLPYGGPLELAGIEPYIDARADIWDGHPFWVAYQRLAAGQYPLARFLRRYDSASRWAVWPLGSPVATELGMDGWRLRYARDGVGVWSAGNGW